MSRFLITVDGEVTLRAGQSLAAHPGIDEVAVLAPSKNGHFPTVDSADGFDVVVGTDRAAAVATEHGLPAAVTGELNCPTGVSLGSVTGLALALAVGVGQVETVAVACPGEPSKGEWLVFPSPLDSRRTLEESVDGHVVRVGRGESPVGAAMVLGSDRHRVVVDDYAFMAGVALAAAAVLALSQTERIPVWVRADEYLRVATEMGLVVGERQAV